MMHVPAILVMTNHFTLIHKIVGGSCSESLSKLIYEISSNGSTLTTDTLASIKFKGRELYRIFLQNNSQLLVSEIFTMAPVRILGCSKNRFCRINLNNDEPCQATEVITAPAGILDCSNAVSGNLTSASVNGYASCSVNNIYGIHLPLPKQRIRSGLLGTGILNPPLPCGNTGVCSSWSTKFPPVCQFE